MADATVIKRKFRLPAVGTVDVPLFRGAFGTAFRDGLLGGLAIFLLITGWMAVRGNDTAWKVQNTLPFKSAAIEEIIREVPHEAQPGLANVQNLNALPPAPIEGVFENFEGKQLPITRVQDELTPFQAYKKPFQPVAGRPIVSFVIIDFGLSESISKSILDNMPGEISLGLTPYADEPSKWGAAARAYGHEFWLMLPMQTNEFGNDEDSGPSTILVTASEKQNSARLFDIMGQSVGYAGFISQKGHEFTPDIKAGIPVLKQIFGRGLAFAESNPDITAFGLSMAMESGYPYTQNNFWLDEDLRPAAIDRKLAEFELLATRKGKAIAFLHPYPAVINKAKEWIESADDKGIQVAPLSAMVQ